MTDRPIATGSGDRVRRSYLQFLALITVFLALAVVVVQLAVRSARSTTSVTAVGTMAIVIGFGLLFLSVILGRTAVTADAVSLPRMRLSRRLALSAQITGIAGFLIVLTVGYLQRRDGDLVLVSGVLLGICSLVPAIFGGPVQRLSLRFAGGQADDGERPDRR